MSLSTIARSCALAILLAPACGFTAEIVIPSYLQDVEGNGYGLAPDRPTRLQYLYSGSLFEPGQQIEISGLAWRPDVTSGGFQVSDPETIIRLSTIDRESLDTRFGLNVGPDAVEVFRGPITLSTNSTSNPKAFSLGVDFQRPFEFDPTKGGLVVDVTFSGFNQRWRVDNQEFTDGKTRLTVGDANATSARNSWPIFAPMQFTVRAVPEPSSGSLSIVAMLLLGFATRIGKRVV